MENFVKFHSLDKQTEKFPKPWLSIYPYFEFKGLLYLLNKKSSIFSTSQHVIRLLNGRNAITHALSLSGVHFKTSVLLPAYHCGSMIEPAVWLNAEVIFYKLKSDLSPDLDDIKLKFRENTKAILVTHYFGFVQDLSEIKPWTCDKKIKLIEDCAHAFWGKKQAVNAGEVGDYAITSCRKFFPCANEGLLVLNNQAGDTRFKLKPIGIKNKFREIKHCFELSLLYSFSKNNSSVKKKKAVSEKQKYLPMVKTKNVTFRWFDALTLNNKSSFFSRFMTTIHMTEHSAMIRRKNYNLIAEAAKEFSKAKPLYTILPDGIVPYMFPMILLDAKVDFPKLKMAGLTVFRWDEMAFSDCELSQSYRLKLIQLPCHQSLGKKDMQWMISQLKMHLGK